MGWQLMARSRNIKPGFFTNDAIGELPALARLLFIGLWTIADREGRMLDRPKKIKAEILPYDDCDPDALLHRLAHAGFLIRYQLNGAEYISIVNFGKHQSPHFKEPASAIPEPVPGMPQASPVPAVLIPDSGLLIPDSLQKQCSATPHESLPNKNIKTLQAVNRVTDARDVLLYLNEKTGRDYQPVPANINLIAARLRDGASVDDCRMVIAKKVREWNGDEMMARYLRPATLFNATKFAQYQGELAKPESPDHE